MHKKINKHHATLLEQIKELSRTQPYKSKLNSSYDGHNEKSYSLSNPQLRKLVKFWLKKNKNISLDDYVELLNSVYKHSKSSTEKYLGGYLVEYLPKLRVQLNPLLLDDWLENLTGWAQVDSLCQSKFSSEDLLNNWSSWSETLSKLNKSQIISKRRASLVLLTRPVRDSEDSRIVDLALKNIDNLKNENAILITKAISWLLREMVKFHSNIVRKYLEKNRESLPKVAVRETKRKLETGRK